MRNLKLISACLMATTAMTTMPFAAQAQDYEDEIIVTATKRATSVQDVPIAVTAVSPTQLENQGVTGIKDLSSVAAGFNIQSSQSETQGTSIRIRGIGTTGNNIGLESAVGVFIDGVYQSRPGIALGELVDVEALELLRGPQGTLFGRNTTAGALNIKTKRPDFDGTSGFANFTYGNYDMIQVQGGINLTASDQLAFRVSGSYHERDGFMESTVVDGLESHDRDRMIIRGQALWEPTDVTSLRIIGDYQESDELCCAAATLTRSPNLDGDPALRDRLFPVVGFEDSVEDYKFNSQIFANATEQKGISAELVHDFGGAEMTLIGSYTTFDADSIQDDFNGSLQYSTGSETTRPGADPVNWDIDTFTAELRFQGEAMDGKLDWLVGGFYSDESIQEITSLALGPDYYAAVGQANFGNQAILGWISGAGNVLNGGAFEPTPTAGAFANNKYNQEAESFSVFTHNIFAVSDSTNITVGARYIDDKKDGSFDQLQSTNGACLNSATLLGSLTVNPTGTVTALNGAGVPAPIISAITGPALGPGAFLNCFPFASPAIGSEFLPAALSTIPFLPEEYDQTFKDDEFIYTIGADTKVGEDTLLYASFSHGYKAGGFNLDATAAAGPRSPQFGSETIDTYEIGMKTTLGDRLRLNITGFWSEMDDFQVLEFTGSAFETFNVDEASSKGVELELNGRLSDFVTANLGVTYADAGYGDNCDRDGVVFQATRLCGSSLTNAPKLTSVMGVTYDGPLGKSDWGLLANINLQSGSERRTSTQPLTAAGALNPFDIQPGYTKVNARLGFTMPNEMVSLELWGRNLTDEVTRGITFNTPLQGASRSAFLEAPRQYGATLRTKF